MAADQRVGDAGDPDDPAAVEHDRVLELRVADLAVGGHRRERADVAVDELRPLADDGRAAPARAHDLGPRLDDDAAFEARLRVDVAVDAGRDRLEDAPVALEER